MECYHMLYGESGETPIIDSEPNVEICYHSVDTQPNQEIHTHSLLS
jgi:hypothetical protein